VTDAAAQVNLSEVIEGRFLVLRKGKKSYHLIRIAD
jgi:hypothetical protein